MKEPTLEQWAELARKHGLRLIALFGSRAKGTANEDSDVNIAVQSAGPLDFPAEVGLRRDVARLWDIPADDLDLVVLSNETNITLAFNIARQGRPSYESEAGSWKAFREDTRRRWLADAPRRKAHDEALTRWTQEIARRGMEDLHDLAVVAERCHEAPITLGEMKRRLKKNGLL